MLKPLFAIGHSTKPIENFIQILHAHAVTFLADVRTIPRSRYNPQYEESALASKLEAAGLKYAHFKDLGGLRKSKPDSVNMAWENKSFRGYADYMQTPAFERALQKLITLSLHENIAFMCAEGNPFRCHRLLLSDALTAKNIPVYHISSTQSKKLHTLSSFAKIEKGKVFYPVLL